jgi:hypothetical protein
MAEQTEDPIVVEFFSIIFGKGGERGFLINTGVLLEKPT